MTYRERVKRKKLQNESYSLWMDMLYRLSLAHHVSQLGHNNYTAYTLCDSCLLPKAYV